MTPLEQAKAARQRLIDLGGDPRADVAAISTAEEDEAQAAALDAIDNLIAFLDNLAEAGKDT